MNTASHSMHAASRVARSSGRAGDAFPVKGVRRDRLAVAARLAAGAACWLALVSGAGLLLPGCRSMDAAATPAPRSGTAELISHAAEQPYTTADTAYQATYALTTGQSFDGEFDALRAKLLEEKLIGNWPYEANERVRKADVGYMICKACKIQTDINWNLTGLGRYAWRELIYHDIASPSGESGFITGGEFVGVLLKAEQYLQDQGTADVGPVELKKPGG